MLVADNELPCLQNHQSQTRHRQALVLTKDQRLRQSLGRDRVLIGKMVLFARGRQHPVLRLGPLHQKLDPLQAGLPELRRIRRLAMPQKGQQRETGHRALVRSRPTAIRVLSLLQPAQPLQHRLLRIHRATGLLDHPLPVLGFPAKSHRGRHFKVAHRHLHPGRRTLLHRFLNGRDRFRILEHPRIFQIHPEGHQSSDLIFPHFLQRRLRRFRQLPALHRMDLRQTGHPGMLDLSRDQGPRLQVAQGTERRQFSRHILGRPRLLAELLQSRLELPVQLGPRLQQRPVPLLRGVLDGRHLPRRVDQCRERSRGRRNHHQRGGPEEKRGTSHGSPPPIFRPSIGQNHSPLAPPPGFPLAAPPRLS